MRLDLRTRRQLVLLNAQDWADFRKHWPMRLLDFVGEFGFGLLLGAALGFSVIVYAFSRVPA